MKTMKIQNVTVAGGGTLGSQIPWQTAFKEFNMIIYTIYDFKFVLSDNG
jgi:3-hydroxybutyryl-CoA dehydrogenase